MHQLSVLLSFQETFGMDYIIEPREYSYLNVTSTRNQMTRHDPRTMHIWRLFSDFLYGIRTHITVPLTSN
jgi:hypothetical protein